MLILSYKEITKKKYGFLQVYVGDNQGRRKNMKKWVKTSLLLVIVFTASIILGACSGQREDSDAGNQETKKSGNGGPEIPEIPEVRVEFGNEPYMDHTQMSIATMQEWTKDIGITITPDPSGRNIPAENCIPIFSSGDVDVISGSVPLFLGASKQMPSFKQFANADIFQGYAIMAQPDAGYKNVKEFMDEGMTSDEAIKAAIKQIKGKKFAYPSETAIKGFINLCLERGGLKEGDFESVIAEDSKTVAMMTAEQVDFETGGVSARLSLETTGYKSIITSADLAEFAEPSPESEELRAVFYDGWLAQDEYIEENYDTILRLTGLNWRINHLINEEPEKALEYHLPYLNSAAGTTMDEETGMATYTSLDPFITFEQTETLFDDTNPLSDGNIIGSYIRMWEEQGYFKEGEVKVEDYSIVKQVYDDMVQYKKSAETKLQEVKDKVGDQDLTTTNEMIEKAEYHLSIFNFLDASRFADAAAEWAEYEAK